MPTECLIAELPGLLATQVYADEGLLESPDKDVWDGMGPRLMVVTLPEDSETSALQFLQQRDWL